jgi:MoxR-like ATPase
VDLDPDQVKPVYAAILRELQKGLVGIEDVIEQAFIAFLCGGHVLLEGVPGLGKTLLVKSLARVLGLTFSRIQFTPDLMPADIVGTNIVTEGENGRREFVFRKGPLFAHLVLADEINRATARTQSALLEAMAESTITVGGQTHALEHPFFVLATQNPIEMDGTYPLPEAQLDRFFFKTLVGFPPREALDRIVHLNLTNTPVTLETRAAAPLVLRMRELVRDVPVAREVHDLAVRIVLATQAGEKASPQVTRKYLRLGSSPRGLIALVHAAKARALLRGRLHVSAEDVREMAAPVLRHRLILSFDGEAEGISTDWIVRKILEETIAG